MNNDQFKVVQARLNLQNLLQIEQAAHRDVIASITKLGELNMELKAIDLRKVKLGKVIIILNKMAKALTDMMNLWRRLQQFFFRYV